MLIVFNEEDYETEVTHYTCPYHKAGGETSYAGCTCSSSYSLKKKPLGERHEEAEEGYSHILRRALDKIRPF